MNINNLKLVRTTHDVQQDLIITLTLKRKKVLENTSVIISFQKLLSLPSAHEALRLIWECP